MTYCGLIKPFPAKPLGKSRFNQQEETLMAEEGGSTANVGVLAIVVIFVLVILVGLYMFRGRIFGGGGRQNIDVNIQTPSK